MITAEQWQLTSFFEAEPIPEHIDIPWAYTTSRFESQVDGMNVLCRVRPSCGDFSVELRREEFEYEFSALGLTDILYTNDAGTETLELRLSEHHSILIQLRPTVSVREHRTGPREFTATTDN